MIKRTHDTKHLGDIRRVIETYATGADRRDIDALDTAFHDHFRVVAVTPDGIRNLDKRTYLDLARAEKIGGIARELDIEWITANGATARAEVRLKAPDKIFHDDLALVDEGHGWKIVNNVTRVEPV